MAKKINTEETPKTEEPVETPAVAVDTQVESVDAVSGNETFEDTSKETSKDESTNISTENESIPPHILELLGKYPAYESLYIDSHGGTFAPNTPAAIRGKAALYKNPYYNEQKNKA